MSPVVKILIGLVAALLMGWLYYGPLGNGEAFVGRLEREATAAVAQTEVPGVSVRMGHDPLSRVATLAGPANPFQREGQGSLKGLNDVVAEVEGVSRVQWADENPGPGTPLILEALLPVLAAYVLGLAAAWLFWGRRRADGYY